MSDKLALRGAVRFVGCAAVAAFIGYCVFAVDGVSIGKKVLYVAACGVCVGIMYPRQAEGEALLKYKK